MESHQDTDVSALALRTPPNPDWPYKTILNQIKARQKARDKLPHLAAHPGIVFPEASVIEQASSKATARYKAGLVSGDTLIDLSGGAGIDCAAMMQHFKTGIAIEQDPQTAAILEHNLRVVMGLNMQVICARSEDAVNNLPQADLAYIDPQRRTADRKGLFKLEHSSPNILDMMPALYTKAAMIMIKTSPVLDIDHTLGCLPDAESVHVVEWRGECREVLYCLRPGHPPVHPPSPPKDAMIHAVTIDDQGDVIRQFSFTRRQEQEATLSMGLEDAPGTLGGQYLYEPSAGFMKAGAYRLMGGRFNLTKLHPHTHLYISPVLRSDFPGRIFQIYGIYAGNGKDLPLTQASITVRNFPAEAASLMKKLGLRDGGPDTVFACTVHTARADNQKILIHARKIAHQGEKT